MIFQLLSLFNGKITATTQMTGQTEIPKQRAEQIRPKDERDSPFTFDICEAYKGNSMSSRTSSHLAGQVSKTLRAQ